MAILSKTTKEIKAKIVFYGPGLGGKTTNIQYIFKKMRPDHRGPLTTLSTKRDRTLYFDFLPVELGDIKGFKTRLHIFTVPGQVFYNATRKAVLKDVDGIVFVADSEVKMQDENIRSLKNLEDNLREYNLALKDIPHIMQYNKRDLPEIMSIEEMHRDLNKNNVPFFEACATTGSGVLNTLKLISKMVLKKLSDMSSLHDESEVQQGGSVYGLGDDYVTVEPGDEKKEAHAQPAEAPAPSLAAAPTPAPEPPPAQIVESPEPVQPETPAPDESGKQWTPGPAGQAKSEAEPEDLEEEIIEEGLEPIEPVEEEAQQEETGDPKAADEFWGDDDGKPVPSDGEKKADAETKAQEEPVMELVEEMQPASVEEKAPVEEPAQEGPVIEGPVKEEPKVEAATEQPAATQKAAAPPPPALPGTLKVYQWGTPEVGENNTLKIPLYFQEPKTGAYYYTSITINMEPLIKTG